MITSTAIKRHRRRMGQSREALADAVGVSAHTIWRWEHGARIPLPEQRILQRLINDKEEKR